MVLLGSTTSKIAIRFFFFLMFCTLMIILFMVDRAFHKRMSIKIKVTSMTRASRDYFQFAPEAYCSTHHNAFQKLVLFIIKHALLDEVGTSNTDYVPC